MELWLLLGLQLGKPWNTLNVAIDQFMQNDISTTLQMDPFGNNPAHESFYRSLFHATNAQYSLGNLFGFHDALGIVALPSSRIGQAKLKTSLFGWISGLGGICRTKC